MQRSLLFASKFFPLEMNKGAIYEYHLLCGPLQSEQQSLGGNPSSEERTSLLLPPALERPEHTQHRRSVSTLPPRPHPRSHTCNGWLATVLFNLHKNRWCSALLCILKYVDVSKGHWAFLFNQGLAKKLIMILVNLVIKIIDHWF